MKYNTIFIIAVLLLSGNLFAQLQLPDISIDNELSHNALINPAVPEIIDSVILHLEVGPVEKYVYVTDEEGKIANSRFMDGTTERITQYLYDSRGNITSYITTISDGSQFVNYFRTDKVYDSKSNLIEETNYQGNVDTWVGFSRFTYVYDSNNNQTSFFTEGWNGSEWVNSNLITTNYDLNGNPIIQLEQDWVNDKWKYKYRNSWEYHDTLNSSSQVFESWNGTDWENVAGTETYYNSHKDLILMIETLWDGIKWEPDRLCSYTYNDDNLLTQHLISLWNGTEWVQNTKRIITYNTQNIMISEHKLIWDGTGWVNSTLRVNNFSEEGYLLNVNSSRWDNANWIPGNTNIEFQDLNGNWYSFYGSELVLYYGSLTDIKTESRENINFNLSQNYPNPFNPTTTIKYSLSNESHITLNVFNLLGQEVTTLVNEQQPAGNYRIKFDASKLSSGIFYYTLSVDGYNKTKKMILLK